MSDERFDRIEQELGGFRVRFDGVDARLDGLDGRMDRLDGRMDRLDGRMDRLDGRMDGLDGRMDELGRHMRVLHESVIDRIAAQREYTGPTREEFAELKRMLERRLDPLELAVRQHSTDIAKLKRARR